MHAIEAKFDSFNLYFRKVEERFDLGELGWERFRNHDRRQWFRDPERWFRGIIFAGNIGLAMWATAFMY